MKNFIISIFGFIIAFTTGVLVMIHGWGLEPKSWLWIIGGGIIVKFIIIILEHIAKQTE